VKHRDYMKKQPTDKKKSYEDLDIYKIALDLAIKVHKITLEDLPKLETYEEGGQIRRSSKSIGANIVEGFGRKHYKGEYIQFLTYPLASCDETKYHLTILYKTHSLEEEKCKLLINAFDGLGRKIYNFRKAIIER
jgi:four helix bundle protein